MPKETDRQLRAGGDRRMIVLAAEGSCRSFTVDSGGMRIRLGNHCVVIVGPPRGRSAIGPEHRPVTEARAAETRPR